MQEKHRRRVDRLSRQEQEEQEGQEEEEELVPGDSISNQGEEGTDDAKLRRISTAERRLVRRELQHQSQPIRKLARKCQIRDKMHNWAFPLGD